MLTTLQPASLSPTALWKNPGLTDIYIDFIMDLDVLSDQTKKNSSIRLEDPI